MRHFDYQTVSLKELSDIEILKKHILKHGSFTEDDYCLCMSRLYLSKNPGKMGILMNEIIRPLITLGPHFISDSCRNSSKVIVTPFEKKHKASDFTFCNGYIQIENYVLESVKIKKIPSYLLDDLNYEFTIVQEARRLDHFHFEPYTDLSVLLNAVETASEQYEAKIEKEKQTDLKEKLAIETVSFLMHYHENMDDNYETEREGQFEYVSDVLLQTSDIDSDDSFCFDLKCDGEVFKVPLDDIEVFDGYVNVNLENIDFFQDVSWDRFCKYLKKNKDLYLVEKFGEEKSSELFKSIKESILQNGRRQKNMKIRTFLSKKSFKEVFIDKWIKNPVRTIYQYTKWHEPKELSFPFYFPNKKDNDGRYMLSQIPICKLKEILSSEPFSFNSKVLERYQKKVSSIPSKVDRIPFWVTKEATSLRISRPFHEPYMNAIFGIDYFINDNLYYILFQESCHHEYDDYSDSKRIESHYSYLLFDIEEDRIFLRPMNSKYASYSFYLFSGADIMVAACFLVRYFTSFETNKRQKLIVDDLWKHFGILGYRK